MKVLFLGAGYSALHIAWHLRSSSESMLGTTRHVIRFPQLKAAGIDPIVYDGQNVSPELTNAISDATHIIISISPNPEDPSLALLKQIPPSAKLAWLGYLSTVGVYGDHGGQWVDESTTCNPVSERSVNRLTVEAGWRDFANSLAIPLSIFRLSGIYGPGKNALMNLSKGKARRLIKPNQVFNRIHVEDIGAGVSAGALTLNDGIVNLTDDLPAPPQDVVTFAADLMGVELPDEIEFDTAELTPMARSFYGENKRVSNQKSKTLSGFRYRYPTYKAGLQVMWRKKTWASFE